MVFWCQRRRNLAGWPFGYRVCEGAVEKIAKAKGPAVGMKL
jgi:hypothetical protein